jgi:hypothetical protein
LGSWKTPFIEHLEAHSSAAPLSMKILAHTLVALVALVALGAAWVIWELVKLDSSDPMFDFLYQER